MESSDECNLKLINEIKTSENSYFYLIGSLIEIVMHDNSQHVGRVFTIDEITNILVLLKNKELLENNVASD
jgi:hypothetical protein